MPPYSVPMPRLLAALLAPALACVGPSADAVTVHSDDISLALWAGSSAFEDHAPEGIASPFGQVIPGIQRNLMVHVEDGLTNRIGPWISAWVTSDARRCGLSSSPAAMLGLIRQRLAVENRVLQPLHLGPNSTVFLGAALFKSAESPSRSPLFAWAWTLLTSWLSVGAILWRRPRQRRSQQAARRIRRSHGIHSRKMARAPTVLAPLRPAT